MFAAQVDLYRSSLGADGRPVGPPTLIVIYLLTHWTTDGNFNVPSRCGGAAQRGACETIDIGLPTQALFLWPRRQLAYDPIRRSYEECLKVQRTLRSISHHCCVPFTTPRSIVSSSIQSTGHTSKHDSQPVQLSAFMTANSLGSFLRGPFFAMSVAFSDLFLFQLL